MIYSQIRMRPKLRIAWRAAESALTRMYNAQVLITDLQSLPDRLTKPFDMETAKQRLDSTSIRLAMQT